MDIPIEKIKYCEICQAQSKVTLANVKVTYGLYEAYQRNRAHHILYLCSNCLQELWNGHRPIRPLVTTGLCHFALNNI